MSRSGRQREQLDLAAELRKRNISPSGIAAVLRDRYGISARLAMRRAQGWTQAEAAAEWTRRWPDDPKTFKTISSWESWPGPTGHAPSLAVLDRLAQMYGCDVADLVSDWGTHGGITTPTPSVEPETLAWQVEHLDLTELARAIADWGRRLPADRRRAHLLKLASAASSAAGGASETTGAGARNGPALGELAGPWISHYRYISTGRGEELEGTHHVELSVDSGRLGGRSQPGPTGWIDLDLEVDGLLVTGSWTEHTDPDGYYGGAVYRGILQLVLDPVGRTMSGRWLGPDRHFVVDTGPWTLTRVATGRA